MPKCHQFQYKFGCKHGKKISTNALSISAIYEYRLDRKSILAMPFEVYKSILAMPFEVYIHTVNVVPPL